MASLVMNSTKVTLTFLIIFSSLQHFSVSSFEYEVRDTKGWVVPPANDTQIYNDWASKNRFQIGDAIRFKYAKDSVMVVTESDYNQCNSSHPIFFSNNGNTVFKFDRAGFFYFISGVSGHCERGQKMVIRVMAPEDSPGGGDDSHGSNAAVPTARISTLVVLQFVLSSLVFHLL